MPITSFGKKFQKLLKTSINVALEMWNRIEHCEFGIRIELLFAFLDVIDKKCYQNAYSGRDDNRDHG